MRLNMSWGTHEEHEGFVHAIRLIEKELRVRVPVIVDLSGPRVQEAGGHHFDVAQQNVLTDKDYADIDLAARVRAEYVAISYVGSARDIVHVRAVLKERGASAHIIAKIERREAIEDYDAIMREADAIMIARGDLGLALPIEEIPFVQKDLIDRANRALKPVIVATDMMTSMMEHDTPTRADVTDIAYAAMIGADAVMLSNETATGDYPLEVVRTMERVLGASEHHGAGGRVLML